MPQDATDTQHSHYSSFRNQRKDNSVNHTPRGRRALPLTLAALAAASALSSAPALAASTKATFKGPTVDMHWGTVKVSIVVKNKKITNVKTTVNIHTDRSQFINAQALPQLKQEVLTAQSASINLVSGATDTSGAYLTSLQSAVNKARKAKALK
jgi:uncharacterized protein with FMN-binding domain